MSFDRGGQTDIIRHQHNGYLARFGDTDDLAAGILWALQEYIPSALLREDACARFSDDTVARQHIHLYNSLMQ